MLKISVSIFSCKWRRCYRERRREIRLRSYPMQIALTAGSLSGYASILTMVYYDAASKKVYSLNAGYNTVLEEKEPLTIPGIGTPSGRTVLVPGFFAGVQAAHDRFGKLPFASLFDPAIYLAEKGFVVDPVLGWINMRKDV